MNAQAVDLATFPRAILACMGGFGIDVVEVRKVRVYRRDYAQYRDAIHFEFVPAGKRKAHVWRATFRPHAVLLAPESSLAALKQRVMDDLGDGCTRTRFATFAEEWRTEWDAILASAVASGAARILFDAREGSR